MTAFDRGAVGPDGLTFNASTWRPDFGDVGVAAGRRKWVGIAAPFCHRSLTRRGVVTLLRCTKCGSQGRTQWARISSGWGIHSSRIRRRAASYVLWGPTSRYED